MMMNLLPWTCLASKTLKKYRVCHPLHWLPGVVTRIGTSMFRECLSWELYHTVSVATKNITTPNATLIMASAKIWDLG